MNQADQVEKNEMGETCCTLGARRRAHWVLVAKSERGHLRDLDVHSRIILKLTSKKRDEAWTRFIWLRIEPGGIFL